jgi:hypothetical protein
MGPQPLAKGDLRMTQVLVNETTKHACRNETKLNKGGLSNISFHGFN